MTVFPGHVSVWCRQTSFDGIQRAAGHLIVDVWFTMKLDLTGAISYQLHLVPCTHDELVCMYGFAVSLMLILVAGLVCVCMIHFNLTWFECVKVDWVCGKMV